MIGIIDDADFPTMTVSDPTYNSGRWDAFVFAENRGADSFDYQTPKKP
jgi:hypothetical protein